MWKDRAAAAETKAKEAEEKAAAAGAKVAGAEKKAKDAEEKASATEARAAAAEAKAKSAEAKASALTKNVDELTTKVKTLGDELSTEHKSDEARELNRKWLRDMLCYFEYRYGESPDLVGKYPYLSGHVDNAESWEWVKGKISGLTGSG